MKAKSKLLALLLASAMVMGAFAGCGDADTKQENTEGSTTTESTESAENNETQTENTTEQVMNLSSSSVVIGVNPLQNFSAPDFAAENMVYDPLVRLTAREGNTSEITPAAAESWDISEDGLTYTFHIREDAKWQDGVALTANDFEYTFKTMADPAQGAVNAWLFDGIITNFGDALYDRDGKTPDDIGVKAIDEHTLEMQLVHPASYFLELLRNSFPIRQDKYEEWGSEYGSAQDKIIACGPFKVESWSQNTEMVTVKNENHWNAANMKLERVNKKIIQETSTAIQAFLNGELDVTGTSDPNWQQQIEASGIANNETVPDDAPEFLMFNVADEWLSNTKIRQALSIAIDREQYVQDIVNGNATAMYSMIPDTMMVGDTEYHKLVDDKNYFVQQLIDENPDPKALLIEGLKEMGKGEDPSVVTLSFASRGTSEYSKKTAEWYKQIWETALGINVQIDMMEWNIMWDKIDAGDYDIACGGWTPDYNEPSNLLNLYDMENGYFNATKSGWSNDDAKQFRNILEQAKNTVDSKEIAELYCQAEELLVKDAVIAPVYVSNSPSYVAKYVKNYPITTVGTIDWGEVYLEK